MIGYTVATNTQLASLSVGVLPDHVWTLITLCGLTGIAISWSFVKKDSAIAIMISWALFGILQSNTTDTCTGSSVGATLVQRQWQHWAYGVQAHNATA